MFPSRVIIFEEALLKMARLAFFALRLFGVSSFNYVISPLLVQGSLVGCPFPGFLLPCFSLPEFLTIWAFFLETAWQSLSVRFKRHHFLSSCTLYSTFWEDHYSGKRKRSLANLANPFDSSESLLTEAPFSPELHP